MTQIDAGNVYLLYVAAGALLKQGKLADALATFERLLAREPRHVPAITERGTVLLELGLLDAARDSAELAQGNGAHIYWTPGNSIPYPGGGLFGKVYTKSISGHFVHVFSPTTTNEFIAA